MKEVQTFTSYDQLQEFILYHGENIVDSMGDEINRLEQKLSVRQYSENDNAKRRQSH